MSQIFSNLEPLIMKKPTSSHVAQPPNITVLQDNGFIYLLCYTATTYDFHFHSTLLTTSNFKSSTKSFDKINFIEKIKYK